MNALNQFRQTKLYEWLLIVLIIISWWFIFSGFQSLINNPQSQKDTNSHHEVKDDTFINPSLAYNFILNKDGTLTVHRLSDKKDFTVKLDKGDK